MKKLYYTISILLISSHLGGVANAKESKNAINKDFYLRADLGATESNEIDNSEHIYSSSGGKKFRDGFAYSVGVGYKLKKNLRTEFTCQRLSNFKYSAYYSKQERQKNYGKYNQKLKIDALMANMIYDIELSSRYRFNPYLGIGIGYSILHHSQALITANNLTSSYGSKKRNRFSYAINSGFAFYLNKQAMLDIGYKFQNFGKESISSFTVPYADTKTLDGKNGFEINTHTIMVGIRYSF
jgi:opacity protein-like surface antigen